MINKSQYFNQYTANTKECAILHTAIMAGDLKGAQKALQSGASLTWRNADQINAFQLAVLHDAHDFLSLFQGHAGLGNLNQKNSSLIEYAVSLEKSFDTLNLLERLGVSLFSTFNHKAWHALHTIAREGEAKYIDHYLKAGVDIDVQDSNGKTPLHYAAAAGRMDIVQKLLTLGADPLAADKTGITPLYLAMTRGKYPNTVDVLLSNEKVMQNINSLKIKGTDETLLMTAIMYNDTPAAIRMIEAGANIHAANHHGQQPLFLAAQKGRIEIIKHLLKHGADVRKATRLKKDNSTLLHHVALDNYQDVVDILIRHGADVNAVDTQGKTPLHHVCKTVTPEKIRVLLSHRTDINHTDQHGRRALDIAMRNGEDGHLDYSSDEINAVLLLLKNGAYPNLPDKTDLCFSPLHQAIRHDNETLVRRLLECGADIETRIKNDDQTTPLLLCAHKGRSHMIPILMQQGADIHAVDAQGRNFLHHCIFQNNFAVGAEIITKKIFNIETKTNTGDTALHLACYDDHLSFVKTLIENGADIHARNNKGQTPIHKAVLNLDSHVLNYLSSDQCPHKIDFNIADTVKGNTPLHVAVKEGGLADLQSLLKVGCDPLAPNQYDLTPLHYAILLKQAPTTISLTQHIIGKEIPLNNVIDRHGNTLLHYAATLDNFQVMAFLMKTGLDINAQNAYGETPLHMAMRRGHIKLAKWMICSKEADVHLKNKKEITPYQIADHHKDHKVKIFIDAAIQEKKNNAQKPKPPAAPQP